MNPKPRPWNVDPTATDPAYAWFWENKGGVDSSFILPFWSGKLDEPDLTHRLRPTLSGSGWSYVSGGIRGGSLKTTGDSRLRYATGDATGGFAEFNSNDKWTVFVGIKVDSSSGEERTVFGKGPNGGSVENRQIYVRTTKDIDPTRMMVAKSNTGVLITGATGIDVGTPYLVALTNDGSGTNGLGLYSVELFTGVVNDDNAAGDFLSDESGDELQLGADFSDTNDDLAGELSFFYYLAGIVATREQVLQLARDPFGPITEVESVVGFVAAGAPAANPHGPLGHPLYGPFAGPIAA